MGIEKTLRSPEGELEYFSVKIFTTDAASFVSPQYLFEMQPNLHNLHINSSLQYRNILHQEWVSKNCRAISNGPQKFSIARRVGREKLSCEKSFEPDPPHIINNDRSLG